MHEHLDPAPAENFDPGNTGHKEGTTTLTAGRASNHDEDELEPTIVRGRE